MNIINILLILVFLVLIYGNLRGKLQEDMVDNTEAIQNVASIYNKDQLTVTNATITKDLNVNGTANINGLILARQSGATRNSALTIPAGTKTYVMYGGDSTNTGGVAQNSLQIWQYPDTKPVLTIASNRNTTLDGNVTIQGQTTISSPLLVNNNATIQGQLKVPNQNFNTERWIADAAVSVWNDWDAVTECPVGWYAVGMRHTGENKNGGAGGLHRIICRRFPFA